MIFLYIIYIKKLGKFIIRKKIIQWHFKMNNYGLFYSIYSFRREFTLILLLSSICYELEKGGKSAKSAAGSNIFAM